jgi:hypothetical protein
MRHPRARGLLLAVCLLLLASCGRDAPTASPGELAAGMSRTTGVRLILVSGGGQTGMAGRPLPEPIVVRVVNAKGVAVAGATVNFLPKDGTADPRQARTDATGHASAVWTLGRTEGAQLLRVSGTGGTLTVTATARRATGAYLLLKEGGDGQTGEAGALLPQRLAVRVVRDDGRPVPASVVVRWRVTSGGGTLADSATRVGSSATASTAWTLGAEVGTQTVEASLEGGASVVFTATAKAPALPPVRVSWIQKRVASPAYGAIDVSRAAVVVNFWIELTARGSVTAMKVRSPLGKVVPCSGMEAWNNVHTEFRCQVYLDRGDTPGLWTVDEVTLVLGTRTYRLRAPELAAMGTPGRAFDVFSTGVDAAAPQMRVVWNHGRSSDPALYWLQLGVVDHVAGVRSVSAVVRGPAGETARCDANPSSGALARQGDWMCPLRLRAGAGRWRLESVSVVDGAGNAATYTPGQIDAAVRGVFEYTFLRYEYDL